MAYLLENETQILTADMTAPEALSAAATAPAAQLTAKAPAQMPVKTSVQKSTKQAAKSSSQSIGQPIGQSVNKSVNKPVNNSVNKMPVKRGISSHTQQLRQRQLLADLTYRDPLTGLLTCDGFMLKYRAAFSYRSGAQGPMHADKNGVLLLLDVDQFRLIQDVYGKAIAQNCLREIGLVLQDFASAITALQTDKSQSDKTAKQASYTCYAARLRADQFAVLLHDVSHHVAMDHLHELCAALNKIQVLAAGKIIDLNVNIGLKPYRRGHTAEQTLTGADLYKQTMIEEDRILKSGMSIKFKREENGFGLVPSTDGVMP